MVNNSIIVIDGHGNFDIQHSYAHNGIDGTKYVGTPGVSFGPSLQFTNNDTVYDLYI